MVGPQMTTPDTDLFSLYFDYVKDTEPPTIYHRWSLITATAAFLGRQFYLPFGTSKLYPNMYTMLIGNPGTRKSSAIKSVARTLASAGYDKFAAERTTKEKFLLDLEGETDEDAYLQQGRSKGKNTRDPGARDILASLDLDDTSSIGDGIPREVFVTADEFNEFVGTGNLDFLSMLGALWDWDSETSTYKHRFKNSKSISVYQPTISILGGNTHAGFQAAFPEAAIGQGFLSRLILVYSEPSGRKITFPTPPDERIAVKLMEQFNVIRTSVRGEATRTESASQALDTIYRTWSELEDYRFKSYSTRRFTHLLKLCLVVTAMRASTRIDVQDVLLANTILTVCESGMSDALGEYGKSRNSGATHALMTALFESKKPMTPEELYKVVQRDLDKRDQLMDLLRNLTEAKKIRYDQPSGGFLPIRKPVSQRAVYVNTKLLKECN
jgi:hypothetical protein